MNPKVRLVLDEEGYDVEVCPNGADHVLTREPGGLWCKTCLIHLREPNSQERIRFRLTGRQP